MQSDNFLRLFIVYLDYKSLGKLNRRLNCVQHASISSFLRWLYCLTCIKIQEHMFYERVLINAKTSWDS